MARTLTAATETAVAGPVTKPIYFCEIRFTTTLYLCSRSDTPWNGQTWQGIGLNPSEISVGAGGLLHTELYLSNADGTFSTLILSEGCRDQYVAIWLGDAAALDTNDPELFFEGVTNGAKITSNNEVIIQCRSDSLGMRHAPRQVIETPVFNHLPAPGKIIAWGDEIFVLE